MTAMYDFFKTKGMPDINWYVDTDGACSHFKNRFTFKFACDFKVKINKPFSYETCQAGHGKSPWDGLCAVIKSWLRRYEILNQNKEGARASLTHSHTLTYLLTHSLSHSFIHSLTQ